MRNNYAKKIIQELFGDNELSTDYLELLRKYGLTEDQGLIIKEKTILSVSHIPAEVEDYEMLLFTIDEFRDKFIKVYSELNDNEINLDKLNDYKPYELYWQITNDQEKTRTIIKSYTGEDYLNEIFLKDLLSFNLLGKYSWVLKILINTPSKELTKIDIRKYFLKKFEEINLLDKIEEKHPQSMKDAVTHLITNLDKKLIEKIKNNENCTLEENLFLGMYIRNEFGLNEKINSNLVYDCYCSKYNVNVYEMMVLYLPEEQSSIILKELKEKLQKL